MKLLPGLRFSHLLRFWLCWYWSITWRFFDFGFVELVDELMKDKPERDFGTHMQPRINYV